MFMKFATAKVTKVYDQKSRTAGTKLSGFDYEPRTDGKYLYAAVRACTADVPNLNYDMLPDRELKTAYKTFIGAYNYLNHDNQDPAKARGAVIDARYHDEDPSDRWIECLIEMDEDRCPKLCSLIRSGEIDTVSMGCNVESTTCSVCGHTAEYPFQYCSHVQQKGRKFGGKLAYEICNGIDFFELSWVYDPADPTAHTEKVASKKASSSPKWDYKLDGYLEYIPYGVMDSPIGPYHEPHMEGGLEVLLTLDGVEVCVFGIDGVQLWCDIDYADEQDLWEDIELMLDDLVRELNEEQASDKETIDAIIDDCVLYAGNILWEGRFASRKTAAPSGDVSKYINGVFNLLDTSANNIVKKLNAKLEKDKKRKEKVDAEKKKFKKVDDSTYEQQVGNFTITIKKQDDGSWAIVKMQKGKGGKPDKPVMMGTSVFKSFEDAVVALVAFSDKDEDAQGLFADGEKLKKFLKDNGLPESVGEEPEQEEEPESESEQEQEGTEREEAPEGSHFCGDKTEGGEPCRNLVSDSLGEDALCYLHRGKEAHMSERDRRFDYVLNFPEWEQEQIVQDLVANGITDEDDIERALCSKLCDLGDAIDISKYRYARVKDAAAFDVHMFYDWGVEDVYAWLDAAEVGTEISGIFNSFWKHECHVEKHQCYRPNCFAPQWAGGTPMDYSYRDEYWDVNGSERDNFDMASIIVKSLKGENEHYYVNQQLRFSSVCGSGSFATAPRVPDDVDIDSETAEACPLCGDPNFDGEYCEVCGYEEPPEGFGDIELEDVDSYNEYEEDSEEEDTMYDFDSESVSVDEEAESKADELAESGQAATEEFGDEEEPVEDVSEEFVEEDIVEEDDEDEEDDAEKSAWHKSASTYELARQGFASLVKMDYPYVEYGVQVDGYAVHPLYAANDEEAVAMFLEECPRAFVYDEPKDITHKWDSADDDLLFW